MRLKRLEVHGFKSFADRTEFGFEPGLTGIVGPNGCGKSNVVDAIKWVLGETRPTSLRGSEMQDVIFKGTASRPPLGFSEVTLILENDAADLAAAAGQGGDASSGSSPEGSTAASLAAAAALSEMSITRRLFRTGDGEYLVNREAARRKDLKNLLADTGLGVNAYSIMEQGKIDAILSANPVDRRAIFEEAAGITRFRIDRKEALRRLEATEKNLESVRAVLAELERQRNSLRVQASRARRHTELLAQLRGWRAAVALARYQEKLAARDAARERLIGLEQEEIAAREARAQAEQDSSSAREEARVLAAEEGRLASSLHAMRSEEAVAAERSQSLRSAAAELGASSAQKSEKSATLTADLGELIAEQEAAAAALAEAERAAEAAAAELSARAEQLRVANEEYRALGRILEEAQRSVLRAIELKTAAENALSVLEHEERSTRAAQDRLTRKLVDLGEEIGRLEPERTAAQTRQDETGRRLADLRGDEARIRSVRESAETALAETQSRLAEIERKLSGVQSRLAVLKELEAGLAGVGTGAKTVLQARIEGVQGLLADRVQAPLEMAQALEAALGRRAGAVVVDSRDTALAALAVAREKKAGRVTLVIASGGELPSAENELLPSGPGVVGRLLDRITVDPALARSIGSVLRNVMVVDSLPDAFRWQSEFPGFVYVTLAGERVDASGVSGGSAEAAATPISRRSAIAAFEAEIVGARREAEIQETLRERARVALLEARGDEDRWRAAIESASREATEAHLALSSSSQRMERLQSEHSVLSAETAELDSRRSDLTVRRGVLEAELADALSKHQEAIQQSADAAEKRHASERARDEAAAGESAARVESARLRGDQDRRRSELARQEDALRRAKADSARLDSEAGEELRRAQIAAEEAQVLEQRIAELGAQRAELEARLLEVREQGAQRAATAEQAVRRERDRTSELERVSSTLSQIRLEEQRSAMQCEEIAARARDEANICIEDFASIFQLEQPFEIPAAEEKVEELRSKLERLGSVNSDVTTELDAVEQRFADLDRQRADLESARKSLEETIRMLDEKCMLRFQEAFESIRNNFAELFRRLFRGGKADIRLSEGGEALEGGIEIFAQPPGKKLQSITLLSGGERTLTALALLFAAFRFKPSPFCVLDEVDAALDDLNVERFIGLVSEFKDSTQFIVVTHHRRTMAACSALLGVTMPEQGVSQKVAVRFEDVDRVVPEAVGSAKPMSLAPVEPEASSAEGSTENAEGVIPETEPVVEIQPAAPATMATVEG